LTEEKKRAGKKAGKEEKAKNVEKLTDEKLAGVAGGIMCRPDGSCQPDRVQCAPPPPPPTREKCRPECAVIQAR
jgi:hypothetical protein